MPRTTLYLVRHGEQDLTHIPGLADDEGAEEPDTGLSARGRDQAARLGRRLAALTRSTASAGATTTTEATGATGAPSIEFATVHHSPLRRAAETAAILAEYLPGVPTHPCDLARDLTPIPSTYPERYQAFFDAVPADERDPEATRLRDAVDQLSVIGAEDQTDLVVTHTFVIGWFVRHVLDAPDWRWLSLNQANCGLTIVQWESGRPPALIAFNDVGHL